MTSRFAALATAAMITGTSALHAQAPFQGTIAYRMQIDQSSVTMTMRTKGARTRTDLEVPGMPGGMFMVMDMDSMVMQTVMPEMGMYMSIDMKTMIANAATRLPVDSLRRALANLTIEPLGTSDVVAGVACQSYRIIQGSEQMESCVATGMGNLGGGTGGREGAIPGLDLDFSAYAREFPNGMLPLRIKTLKNGAWQTTMEALTIDQQVLDDAIFAIPPGLTRIEPPTH